MSSRRRSRRRRNRSDYLDAAVSLADRRAATGPLHAHAVAHVDIAQVAEVAGVSRTALYRLWETQDRFRADLAAFLAGRDDAPWMDDHAGLLDPPPPTVDRLLDATRRALGPAQNDGGRDPRLLLRAGVAGFPSADPVTAVLADRETARLARHATRLDQALARVGRRGAGGVVAADLSAALASLADGVGLAARLAPAPLREPVPRGDGGRSCLLALASNALLTNLTEPGQPDEPDEPDEPDDGTTWREPHAGQPAPPATHSGRRRHYLEVAARLATSEGTGDAQPVSTGLGFIGLDALARTEGVTRAAFRKLWPTQTDFGLDLAAHMLARQRGSVIRHVDDAGVSSPGSPEDVLLHLGETLMTDVCRGGPPVNHLAVAPQLVVPAFRRHLQARAAPLVDETAAALQRMLSRIGRRPRPGLRGPQLAVVVLATLDGTTRLARSLPAALRDQVVYGGRTWSGPAITFAQMLMGLTQPTNHGHLRSAS